MKHWLSHRGRGIGRGAFAALLIAVLTSNAMAAAKMSGHIIDSTPGHGMYFVYVVRLSTTDPVAGSDILTSAGSWEVRNIPDGSYFIVAWRDLNGNLLPSRGEPVGFYGNPIPAGVQVSGGDLSNVDITMHNFAIAAEITGKITYNGSKTGRIWIIPHFNKELTLGAIRGTPWTMTTPGDYNVFVFQDGSYYVTAYMDVNGNLLYDAGEPSGVTANPTSVAVTPGVTYPNANIELKDGGVAVEGQTWTRIKQLYN